MKEESENESAYRSLALIFLFGVIALLGGIAALPLAEWVRWFLAAGVLLGIGVFCATKIE